MKKIKVPGCSACKRPYDWSAGIKSDESGLYLMCPLCKNDEKHNDGYVDILVEVTTDN